MEKSGTNAEDPEIDRINLRISQSFIDVVDEAWRERGFNSRSEFIRYALREAANYPEGAGLWRDLAISDAQFGKRAGLSSEDVKATHGLGGQ